MSKGFYEGMRAEPKGQRELISVVGCQVLKRWLVIGWSVVGLSVAGGRVVR